MTDKLSGVLPAKSGPASGKAGIKMQIGALGPQTSSVKNQSKQLLQSVVTAIEDIAKLNTVQASSVPTGKGSRINTVA